MCVLYIGLFSYLCCLQTQECLKTVLVEAVVLVLGARLDIAVLFMVLLEGITVIDNEVNAEATDAEPGIMSSLEFCIHIHLSPTWTVSGIVTIMAIVEVASVLA